MGKFIIVLLIEFFVFQSLNAQMIKYWEYPVYSKSQFQSQRKIKFTKNYTLASREIVFYSETGDTSALQTKEIVWINDSISVEAEATIGDIRYSVPFQITTIVSTEDGEARSSYEVEKESGVHKARDKFLMKDGVTKLSIFDVDSLGEGVDGIFTIQKEVEHSNGLKRYVNYSADSVFNILRLSSITHYGYDNVGRLKLVRNFYRDRKSENPLDSVLAMEVSLSCDAKSKRKYTYSGEMDYWTHRSIEGTSRTSRKTTSEVRTIRELTDGSFVRKDSFHIIRDRYGNMNYYSAYLMNSECDDLSIEVTEYLPKTNLFTFRKFYKTDSMNLVKEIINDYSSSRVVKIPEPCISTLAEADFTIDKFAELRVPFDGYYQLISPDGLVIESAGITAGYRLGAPKVIRGEDYTLIGFSSDRVCGNLVTFDTQ